LHPSAVAWQEWLLLAGLLLLNALFAAAEVAIASAVGRGEIRQELEHNPSATGRLVLRLGQNSTRLLATVRLGVTLAGFFAAASVAHNIVPAVAAGLSGAPLYLPEAAGTGWAFFLTVFLLAGLMLLFGELLPKALADHYPRPLALLLAWPMQVLSWLLYPLRLILTGISDLVVRALGGRRLGGLPYAREEEIRTLVDASEEGGAIEQEEKEMISGILEMGETLVREVMVPRTDIVAIDVQTPLLQALDPILQTGHSRIPVYQETIDHIVGLLYAKDTLASLRDCQHDRPVRELLRPAYFVPETKVVDDLLRELQGQHVHMAIVVDEYGGTAGLVTIEDLLEEIVGEIQDEYDTEEPLLQEIGPGEYISEARLSVDDAEKLAGLQIPEGDFDTLGGFIYERLGAIPKVGDEVVVGDATITVTEVLGVRPVKLHIRRGRETPPAPEAAGEKETAHDERAD
jgi:putative hemolysin